jgi:prepilin-type N-terminal cleavage/methylation domain-containing protein
LARLRARADGEEGFTVIEMMVAVMVLAVVMTSLVYVTATSLKQVSFAKQRQVAGGLVDKTMEQARALPYQMIQTGLDDHDVTTSSDSNISVSGSTYTFTPTGETIVHGNQNGSSACPGATVCQAPLIPHRSTTALNKTTYTVSTYLTNYSGNSGAYRITVIVSWTPSQVTGVSNKVSSQSVLYSPSNGCLSDQTHPFSAPCQPFLYAQSTTGKGAITISPPTGLAGNAIQGVSLDSAQLNLAQTESAMQIEQTSKVEGSVTTGGSTLSVGGTPLTPAGSTTSSSQTDNDPATNSSTQPSCPISQSSTTTQSYTGGSGNGVALADSSGDSGCTVSTAQAASSSSPTCNDISGLPVNTSLPCGSGNVQQTGSTQSASLTLGLGGVSLGSTALASVAAAPSASKVLATRLKTPSGTSCASTTGDGCVHAEAVRSIGTLTLGAMPSSVLSLLPGWGSGSSNFLLKLQNYTDSVSAESGIGVAAPCANEASTCAGTAAGTVVYWNGTGYTTKTINWSVGASVPALNIPSVSVTGLVSGALVNISMTNTLSFGAPTTTTSGSSPCQISECKATAQVSSPIQGDIIYTVSIAGTQVANLDINVNLGTLAVQTNYKAAPNAG